MSTQLKPEEALARLKTGNSRFVAGVKSMEAMTSHKQRAELAESGQTPYAIILGCADSRVPAELVFDVGLGDLFVVRVAGNIVAPSLIGSIEFAATNFGTPLCVVLGHTRCGAVAATAEAVVKKQRAPTDHIQNIVLQIEPSVKLAMAASGTSNADLPLMERAARLNVANSVSQLTERSKVISDLVSEGKLKLVGGIYNLHTGEVEFLEQ